MKKIGLLAIGAIAPLVQAATAFTPSPANFETVETHTITMQSFLTKKRTPTSYYPDGLFFKYTTKGTADRIALGDDYAKNGIVTLSWKGTSGSSTVTVTRLSDGYVQTLTTSGTSVELLGPEIGRNYKWTVKNGSNTAGPWYFYTDGEAPRIIPQKLAKVGNCRDMGGWVTADGKYRVRQGVGFRCDHNADSAAYKDLKPFWTDIVGIRTDMDLRDMATATQWYCNWELDSNGNSIGRSPYGENWWSVQYWNVLREGASGAVMNAYRDLVINRGSTSKRASVNTWKCFADAQYLPIVVHGSQGRDRTGTVAFVLLGALGVGLNDLYADWALTDYAAPSDFPKESTDDGISTIVALHTQLRTSYPDGSYKTLQDKCVKLLKDMGMSDAQITNLKSYLLEPVEPKLTAAPGGTSVAVPTLSKTRVSKADSAQKPTVNVDTAYATVDYGGGDYTDCGKYLVTVTLKDPATTHWSDGTIGPKVLPFVIEHDTNVFNGNAVTSWIKGDMNFKIRIGMPSYLGEVTCSYTEEQLGNLAPGTYEATFTAKVCEMASKQNTTKCKFTVYPATEKPEYLYEYADLKNAYFKTDYVPTIQTDKVEVRIMDQSTSGGGYFDCGPYPTQFSLFKLSDGVLTYYQGTQNVKVDNSGFTWAQNKVYTLTASGKTVTLKDEAANTTYSKTVTLDAVKPVPGSAFIGVSLGRAANRGAEGVPTYHEPHRLYHVKAWANGTTLIHEFVPCKTRGGHAMLYDKVTDKLYPFSHTLGNTGTVTLGGTATKISGEDPGPSPIVDPTTYGVADTKAATYTWKGGNGPWEHTTNWTASADATYGIPNNKTYATADFPATLTEPFTCTVSNNASVLFAKFDAPNMTLVIDNASLTCNSRLDTTTWGAYNFGNTATGNPTVEFRGAGPALVSTKETVRANFGYLGGDAATGVCTVRFVVPPSGWETVAPIRATGLDSKVCFWNNVRFDIDARQLGVPETGASKRVLLASGTDGVFFAGADLDATLARSAVTCASGASGRVVVEGNDLVLVVRLRREMDPLGVCSWSWHEPMTNILARMEANGFKGIQLALSPWVWEGEGSAAQKETFGDQEGEEVFNMISNKFAKGELAIHATMICFSNEDYTTECTISNTCGFYYGLAPSCSQEEKDLADLTWTIRSNQFAKAVERTRMLGVRNITAHIGLSHLDDADKSRLYWACKTCQENGCKLLVETGMYSAEETVAALTAFTNRHPDAEIALNFDTANQILYGADNPTNAYTMMKPWIEQVHIKDCHEPYAKRKSWAQDVEWGRGDVSRTYDMINVLKQDGFAGPMLVEHESGSADPDVREREILTAVSALRGESTAPVEPGWAYGPFASAEDAAEAIACGIVVFEPADEVRSVLEDSAILTVDGYKALFAPTFASVGEKTYVAFDLNADGTNVLARSADAVTTNLDVSAIAALPAESTTNLTVKGGLPGFYYTLYGADGVRALPQGEGVTGYGPVLCGEEGEVTFKAVTKPSEAAGFFSIGARATGEVGEGDVAPSREVIHSGTW